MVVDVIVDIEYLDDGRLVFFLWEMIKGYFLYFFGVEIGSIICLFDILIVGFCMIII